MSTGVLCSAHSASFERIGMMTSVNMPGAAWSRAFASAQRSAMEIYAEVMVPRMFEPWGRELLGELAVKAGDALARRPMCRLAWRGLRDRDHQRGLRRERAPRLARVAVNAH